MSGIIQPLSAEEKHIISNNNALNRYLLNLNKTQPPTQRSWLYEDKSASDILHYWQQFLHRSLRSKWETRILELEDNAALKFGPQGGHKPISSLLPDVFLPSFEPDNHETAFKSKSWKQAKLNATSILRKAGMHSIRPKTLKQVLNDMTLRGVLESNSGWPDFTRRNSRIATNNAVAAASDSVYEQFPAIALIRYYRKKSRSVWMFPYATNLVEGQIYQPLQQSLLTTSDQFFSPWKGFEAVRDVVTRAYDSGWYISASDFSSTDQHFKLSASMEVFDVLRPLLVDFSAASDLKKSLIHMHNIPLIVSTTEKLVGQHGVSSGSNWTNFVETIFDLILSEYVALHSQHVGLYAIGDDMTWVTKTFSDAFSKRLERFGEDVGQVIKSEKTTNERDYVVTLQRLFQRGYRNTAGQIRGVYPTIRALNSSIYPERYHKPSLWSSDMFCVRQFMILENCVDHPLFEDFVRFICKGSKYLIPFAKRTAEEIDDSQRKAKLIPGLTSTYNQEKRSSPLSSFQSIEIARET